ncbi:hypothetical protein C1J03_09705 [Sulfitobacter sp. SK012]|uniref:hypothetical protein n=1 Tax=Sulfitobacter sp. SK012 TaxID=1389005 RepID=UPI000E0AD5B0|nr:hypothetical protein [Sulfitobacter sp. SK012]AXI46275.1 hypothetical protein C1J03_09705 [Sulfitobacter sp. SK012]
MLKMKSIAAAAIITAALTTSAGADTFEKYGEVEGWKVFADKDKMSCLIEAVDSAENVVQMGLTEDRSLGYLGVFTKGETNLKKDDREAVVIVIGENTYYGEATGMRGNITKGYSGGYITNNLPQFVKDIEQQYEMVVFPETDYVFVIDLTGTKKAIAMARECNAKLVN